MASSRKRWRQELPSIDALRSSVNQTFFADFDTIASTRLIDFGRQPHTLNTNRIVRMTSHLEMHACSIGPFVVGSVS